MKNRLFTEGWLTSIIGLIMECCAVYMYLHPQKFTTMEAGEMSALGLIFLRSKNSLVDLRPKKSDTPSVKK